jgi:hypothetical protein
MKELVMLVGALLVLAVAPALAQQQTFRDAGGRLASDWSGFAGKRNADTVVP